MAHTSTYKCASDRVPRRPPSRSRPGANEAVSACRSGGSEGAVVLQLDPRVVMLEDLVVLLATDGHAVRADLTKTDPVTPPLAAEDEGFDAAVLGADAVDGEEVLLDAEGGADAEAAQEELAAAP